MSAKSRFPKNKRQQHPEVRLWPSGAEIRYARILAINDKWLGYVLVASEPPRVRYRPSEGRKKRR